MKDFSWLPALITLGDHNGDILYYTNTLYQTFLTDLIQQRNTLLGKRVFVSSKLEPDGRHERFWHVITDPHNPNVSDIKHPRAERIAWIKAIIDNHQRPEVLIYDRVKDGKKKVYLFIPEHNYIVILGEKGNNFYFVTAFHIAYTYKLNDYKKEYAKYGPRAKV